MPLLNRLTYVGIAKETTMGTAVAPTLFLPVTMAKPEDKVNYVEDESLFGNPSKVRGVYAGEADSTFDLDGYLYPEAVGFLMVAAGLLDAVTGVSPNYTHTFKVPASGTGQPPTYTITDFNVVEARAWPGQILDTLDLTIDSKGAIKYAAKFKGWPSVTASTPTPTFATSPSLLAWETQATIAGAAVARVMSSTLALKRFSEVIHTLQNVTKPYSSFSGGIDGRFKLKCLLENNTELNHFLTNDQPTNVLTITAPSGGPPAPVVTITSTKGAWILGKTDRSKAYMDLESDVVGVYNATDLGPLAVTLLNNVATAY